MMKVKLCGFKYRGCNGNWADMYNHVISAFQELGADIECSPYLKIQNMSEDVKVGIKDEDDAIYVYNHTYLKELDDRGFARGKKTLILKPTAPSPRHFTIDEEGYAAASSVTYTKPAFESYDPTSFFEVDVPGYIKDRETKWSDRDDLQFDKEAVDVPEDHVLLIGQMPGDETVNRMSFGDHWRKYKALVNELKDKHKLVLKIHPTLLTETAKTNSWEFYHETIREWQAAGITVFYHFESLYDILPKTKVAIIENSTSGFECLMYHVPVISYGYPEYHWVTKDLRHLYKVSEYVSDLSWHDKDMADRFVAWYCQDYQCYDKDSTLKRIKEIIA